MGFENGCALLLASLDALGPGERFGDQRPEAVEHAERRRLVFALRRRRSAQRVVQSMVVHAVAIVVMRVGPNHRFAVTDLHRKASDSHAAHALVVRFDVRRLPL